MLAAAVAALLVSAPWYERESCDAANQLVVAADFTNAEPKIKALEASKDTEDQACGVWIRATMSEAQIAVFGKTKEMLAAREKALLRMFGFSKAHAKVAPYFADMELEARMRRVRALVDAEERGDALKEIRNVNAQLTARKGEPTPTLLYVRGIANMAVSQAPWALRTLMSMAGIDGDAKVGRESLRSLFNGKTVYRVDARYVMRYFAEASPGGDNGSSTEYSKTLHETYPTNPQFTYDYARDLQRENKCKDVLLALGDARETIEKDPAHWSNVVRAKIFWLTGRCAFDTGDKERAKKYAELAGQQGFEELADEIEKLKKQLQ